MTEFSLRSLTARLLRGWWLIALLALGGALFGRLAGLFLPPVYTARAEYYVGVDESYFRTEEDPVGLALSDFKDVTNEISALMTGPEVATQVAAVAAEKGVSVTPDEFLAAARVDRYYTTWVLSVSDRDPRRAEILTQTWLRAVDDTLQQAYAAGRTHIELRLTWLLWEGCFADGDLAAGNACAGTSFESVEQFRAGWNDLASEMEAYRLLGHGLTPQMTLRPQLEPEMPSSPERNHAALLTLAGAALGWLAGLVLTTRMEFGKA